MAKREGYSRSCNGKALRFARRLAYAEGILLTRFRRVSGTDDSSLGPEWCADEIRNGPAYVSVLHAMGGDDAVNDAIRSGTATRVYSGLVFVVSIRGLRKQAI